MVLQREEDLSSKVWRQPGSAVAASLSLAFSGEVENCTATVMYNLTSDHSTPPEEPEHPPRMAVSPGSRT